MSIDVDTAKSLYGQCALPLHVVLNAQTLSDALSAPHSNDPVTLEAPACFTFPARYVAYIEHRDQFGRIARSANVSIEGFETWAEARYYLAQCFRQLNITRFSIDLGQQLLLDFGSGEPSNTAT